MRYCQVLSLLTLHLLAITYFLLFLRDATV